MSKMKTNFELRPKGDRNLKGNIFLNHPTASIEVVVFGTNIKTFCFSLSANETKSLAENILKVLRSKKLNLKQ